MALVLSIDKGLDILEAVARHRQGIGTRALAKELDINITTVHNMAATLKQRGYLQQDPHSKRFTLGSQLQVLARNANLTEALTQNALPFVRQMAHVIGETVMLAALVERRMVRLIYLTSPQALCVQEPEDLSSFAYCTASGKVLLAAMPGPVLEAYLRETPLMKYTDSTLHQPAKLRAEIEIVRHQGFATTRDEYCEGVSAVAVPVPNSWGTMAAALGIGAPTIRFDAKARARALEILRQNATLIAQAWWSHQPKPGKNLV
jgi:DNA-binding IclR family transcriptional regulator